ncbi:MAG: hypothetical protein AAF466_08450 [Bacteroidota bacterium]
MKIGMYVTILLLAFFAFATLSNENDLVVNDDKAEDKNETISFDMPITACGVQIVKTPEEGFQNLPIRTDVPADPCTNFDSPIQNEERIQLLIPPSDLRNFRYGEVIPTFVCGDGLVSEVYVTLSFSDCPDEDWYALNAEDIKSALGSVDLKLNGPRHWLVNGIVNNNSSGANGFGKIQTFGTLQMGLAAQINAAISTNPYTENEVQRSTTYTFNPGNEIYKLVNAKGDEYIMQSYSRIVNPDLNIDDLPSLGSSLKLPDGWSFVVETLSADLEVIADGIAYVITDDLENTYQKIIE